MIYLYLYVKKKSYSELGLRAGGRRHVCGVFLRVFLLKMNKITIFVFN